MPKVAEALAINFRQGILGAINLPISKPLI